MKTSKNIIKKGYRNQMKVLSYNIYGVKNTTEPTPKWEVRQENIKRILNNILKDNEI